jgi:hypothetical protein
MFRSGLRFPGLSLVDAIEQSIANKERLEREAREAEAAKETERQEKAAEKEARAAEKELGPARNSREKSSKKTVTKAGAASRPRKRKEDEVDRDFAEGGEDLEYIPRPSKSRAVEGVEKE